MSHSVPDRKNPIDHVCSTVFRYVKAHLEKTDTHVTFELKHVYAVSFTYILGGWKAMVSTTLPDGMYYEVTYDKENKRTYLDAYRKWENVCIPDVETAA